MITLRALLAAISLAHAIHSSVTEIAYDARSSMASVTVRVFADDLGAAVGPVATAADLTDPRSRSAATVLGYLGSRLQITDRTGRRLPLLWRGVQRSGPLLLVSLSATAPSGIDDLNVRDTILTERFADQINIVQAALRGRRASTLFARGDGEKRLH